MRQEEADVDVVKAVTEHHYFKNLLETQVDKASLDFWRTRWKIGVVVFGVLSVILGYFGVTQYFSLKAQYANFQKRVSDIEATTKRLMDKESLIEASLKQIEADLKQVEKLRAESSNLVASSSLLIGDALKTTEAAS